MMKYDFHLNFKLRMKTMNTKKFKIQDKKAVLLDNYKNK